MFSGEDNCLLRGYTGDKKRFLLCLQRKLRIYLAVTNPFPDTAEFECVIMEMFDEMRMEAITSKGKEDQLYSL